MSRTDSNDLGVYTYAAPSIAPWKAEPSPAPTFPPVDINDPGALRDAILKDMLERLAKAEKRVDELERAKDKE